jgi:hypothetical protein
VKVVFTTTQGYAYAEYGRLVPLLTREFTGKRVIMYKKYDIMVNRSRL